MRYSVTILLIPLCTDICRNWANTPESSLKWPVLRLLRRILPFYTPVRPRAAAPRSVPDNPTGAESLLELLLRPAPTRPVRPPARLLPQLTIHSVLCGSSAARILAAFSRRRAIAILWTCVFFLVSPSRSSLSREIGATPHRLSYSQR